MKTRVASSHANKELRAQGFFKKRNLAAYIVRIEGQEDIPFEYYQMAYGCCVKKAQNGMKAVLMENAGDRDYIVLDAFEKDPTTLIEEVRNTLSSRHATACATGKTSVQRWQNAIQNVKVPILLRSKNIG